MAPVRCIASLDENLRKTTKLLGFGNESWRDLLDLGRYTDHKIYEETDRNKGIHDRSKLGKEEDGYVILNTLYGLLALAKLLFSHSASLTAHLLRK